MRERAFRVVHADGREWTQSDFETLAAELRGDLLWGVDDYVIDCHGTLYAVNGLGHIVWIGEDDDRRVECTGRDAGGRGADADSRAR